LMTRCRGIALAAPLPFARRCVATPAAPQAASETAFGILQALEKHSNKGESSTDDGQVLSVAGGLARCTLPESAAIGQEVCMGASSRGVVLRYDRKGVVAALVSGKAPTPGTPASCRGRLSARAPSIQKGDVTFSSVADLLSSQQSSSTSGVLRLPSMPSPPQRQPVIHHMPSGLAAVEALLPFGEGHRIGLVGPPTTGKTSSIQMLMDAQAPDTVCVYSAHQSLPRLQAKFGLHSQHRTGGPIVVVHSDPVSDPPGAHYLLPLCALHVATQLRKSHRHVLLILDDLIVFADAASKLGPVPLHCNQVVAAALDSAGRLETGNQEQTLSAAAVLDLGHDDELPPVLRDLWRSTEPSLDVCLNFSLKLASDGILPAIDTDHLLADGFGPQYQVPILQKLRRDLLNLLRQSRDLRSRLERMKQLGLHAEPDEMEKLCSANVVRALFRHSTSRNLSEVTLLMCAVLVLHFPQHRPTPRAVTTFQQAIVSLFQDQYPSHWEQLCRLQSLNDIESLRLVQSIGEVLLAHRFDFDLVRPSI